MTGLAAALEATRLAQFLKVSEWVYPLVNAGHILGIALLVGAIVPMDLRLIRGDESATWLRRYAAAGFAIAAACGLLLFVTQATDYVVNGWFKAKMAVLALAIANVALHHKLAVLTPGQRRVAAGVSLASWPIVLLLGRIIAYGR